MGTETKLNCYTKNGTSNSALSNTSSASASASSSAQNSYTNVAHDRINGKETLNVNNKSSSASSSATTVNTIVSAVRNNEAAGVDFVPLRIDENDVVGGAKELLKTIRPDWNLKDVKFKKFTDGITNKLVGCFYTKPDDTDTNGQRVFTNGHTTDDNNEQKPKNTNGLRRRRSRQDNDDSGNLSDDTDSNAESESGSGSESESSNSSSVSGSNNVVLVRVYGNKTDLLIDRKAEMRNMLLLHSYGMAPPLYATFKNGLAYDYVPGVTLNTDNVLEPKVWRLVARRMAEMHRIVKTGGDDGDVPMLWKKTQSFLNLVPERYSDPSKHKRLAGTFLPITKIREEFEFLYARLEALNSPIVFAHNDLLLGNVVYNETQETVDFIDYEYADYNFQAFDIGNHFAEFAGVDEVDYSRYPSREFQYEWLKVYLQEYLMKSQITDDELHRLYVQVNQFSLASNFFWTIWCLIQAEHSKIDFDYVEYAFTRYNEYLARKDEFLALDINASS